MPIDRNETWFQWAERHIREDERRIAADEQRFLDLKQQVESMMATIQDLQAKVAQNTTVIGSAVTLIQGLSAELKAALAANDPTAIQSVIDQLDAADQSLATAVTANTEVDPARAANGSGAQIGQAASGTGSGSGSGTGSGTDQTSGQ